MLNGEEIKTLPLIALMTLIRQGDFGFGAFSESRHDQRHQR
jgi:hypothetical protein